METTMKLMDGTEIRLKATARTPLIYAERFPGRDLMVDIRAMAELMDNNSASLPVKALEMYRDIAWTMAYHADPDSVPLNQDEWLDSIPILSIYQTIPVIIALWQNNLKGLVTAKKKLERQTAQ